MINIFAIIVKKLTSGRFLAFLMITWTLCYAVILSVNAVLGVNKNIDATAQALIEKVAMFILGAFTSIATGVYKEYWDQARAQTETKPPEVKP
jgi:hypothetical protein